MITIFLTLSCQQAEKLDEYLINLPEVPSEILANLDTVRMRSIIPTSRNVQTKPQVETKAPCCSLNTHRSVKVTFPFTRCGPISDFRPTAPDNMVVAQTNNEGFIKSILLNNQNVKLYKLKGSNPQATTTKINICMTSNGPWNAELRESEPCSGPSSFSLIASAFDEIIPVDWTGSISNHPANIDLVECRLESRFGSNCGISNCECPFFKCTENEVCNCTITETW